MNYSIDKNDRLIGSTQISDLSFRDVAIDPLYCVIHYTGGSSLDSSIDHLRSVGYSYQILIDRDGTVVQGTPISKRARHAGYSNWQGKDFVNDFGIGISLANFGYLDKHGDHFYNTNGHNDKITPTFSKDEVVYSNHWNRHIGSKKKGWELYTEAQYNALTQVIDALLKKFPNIVDAIGHEDIAIGRKPDPGPAFDWSKIHDLFTKRKDDLGPLKKVVVGPEDTLNVRSGPSGNWGVIDELKDGASVHIRSFAYKYRNGTPHRTEWASVAHPGTKEHIGFVSSKYLFD